MKLLNIVTFLTFRVILGDHPTRLKKYRLHSNKCFQIQNSKKQEYCYPNCLCPIKKNPLNLFISALVMSQLPG